LGEFAGLLPGQTKQQSRWPVLRIGGQMLFVECGGFNEPLLLVKLPCLLFCRLRKQDGGQEQGSNTHGTILRRAGKRRRRGECGNLDRDKGDWFWLN
jgi:hypothetical protein